MEQPHLKVKGIWRLGGYYYIVCPGLRKESLTIDGDLFSTWFRRHKILTSPTRISAFIPKGARQVRSLTQIEVADLAGSPRNLTFFYYDLLLNLPKTFPDFKLEDKNGTVTVLSEKSLTDIEVKQFHTVLAKLNENINIAFRSEVSIEKYQQPILDQPILLRPSRTAFRHHPELRQIWEEDEDFWMSQKYELLRPGSNRNTFLHNGWLSKSSSCMVSDYAQTSDIRCYLTLYNTVFLRLPILEHHEMYMRSLGCTIKELQELCHLGRVKLVLDQPLHRYNPEVCYMLTEVDHSQYILSRRLAAVTVSDLRQRMPFLFSTLDLDTKYELLHELYHTLRNKHQMDNVAGLIQLISTVSEDYFENIQRLGSRALVQSGIYHILQYLFSNYNKDYGVEIMDTAPAVGYAAAFGANLISKTTYNDAPLAQLVAQMLSGLPKKFVPGNQLAANTAVDGVMIISKDVPLTAFAQSFHSDDIDRLRKMIYDLTKHVKNDEELAAAVYRFNEDVKAYAHFKNAKDSFDIRGFLVDSATGLAGTSVPLAGWFIERMISVLKVVGWKKRPVRRTMDYLESIATGSVPDAVLVARMREQLSQSWSRSKFGYD